MRKQRYSEEQIAFVLKQAELGAPVEEVCRQHLKAWFPPLPNYLLRNSFGWKVNHYRGQKLTFRLVLGIIEN